MQNRTMRAAVSTRQPAASRQFCMTWRTFTENDPSAAQASDFRDGARAAACLRIETWDPARSPDSPRQPPTVPFTIGLKAIKGSSVEPTPRVLIVGLYKVGHADI